MTLGVLFSGRARHRGFALACCLSLSSVWLPATHARTLEQIRSLNAISVCANPSALPYSSQNPESPGFQIEIAEAIAKQLGVQLKVDWVVPRRRVREVNCDLLLDSANDPKMYEDRRLLSSPYQRSGIALALGAKADGVATIAELKDGKVGVMISSLASVVLGKQGVRTSPYSFQDDMLEDVRKGELAAGAVSAAALGYYIKQHPEAGLRELDLYESEPQLAWTVSVGLRNADEALRSEVNRAVAALLDDGTIARIYAKYGIRHTRP
jgi:polar amino acid transport system substrate-binding protein